MSISFERNATTEDIHDVNFISNVSLVFSIGVYTTSNNGTIFDLQTHFFRQLLDKPVNFLRCHSGKERDRSKNFNKYWTICLFSIIFVTFRIESKLYFIDNKYNGICTDQWFLPKPKQSVFVEWNLSSNIVKSIHLSMSTGIYGCTLSNLIILRGYVSFQYMSMSEWW